MKRSAKFATGVRAKRATMQRNTSEAVSRVAESRPAPGVGWPRLSPFCGDWPGFAVVRIISECAPAWQGRDLAVRNYMWLKALQRAAVPANCFRELGRDGNHREAHLVTTFGRMPDPLGHKVGQMAKT
jgi:hypothetical protein